MKQSMQSIRSLRPLLACLILSACGGQNLNSAYPQSQMYGQNQMGQMSYGQPGQMGQMTQPGYSQPAMGQGQMGQNPYAQPGQQPYGQDMSKGYAGQPQGMSQNQAPRPQSQVRLPGNSRPTPEFSQYAQNTQALQSAPKAPTKTASKPAAQAPRPAAPVAKAPEASEFLAKARQAVTSMQSLSATVATFEKGAKTGQGKIQYYFRNNQIKIDVLASTDASRNGVKIAFNAGASQVQVRPSGLLKLMSLSLAMTDPKLLSGRKYQIGQIDLIGTVNRLAQPNTQARVLGKSSFAGSEIILLEITSPNPFDPAVTKEHLGLDAKTFLPRVHEMYAGAELVYAGRVEQMTPNAPITDAMMQV